MIQYAYDVFQAVDYLHKQNPPIIHRDIKPENILFCGETLKIADFGWSNLKDQVRHTFCGTPEYLAPEMLMEKGHNEKLDVWTLGILLYEMLVGVPPFTPKDLEGKRKGEIEEELKNNIVNGKVEYPSYLSADAVDLLGKLLVRKPGDRISCHDALRHRFFINNGLIIEEFQAHNVFKNNANNSNRKPLPKVLLDSDVIMPTLISSSSNNGNDTVSRKVSSEQKLLNGRETPEINSKVSPKNDSSKVKNQEGSNGIDSNKEIDHTSANRKQVDISHKEKEEKEICKNGLEDKPISIVKNQLYIGGNNDSLKFSIVDNSLELSKTVYLDQSSSLIHQQMVEEMKRKDEQLNELMKKYEEEKERSALLEKQLEEKDNIIENLSRLGSTLNVSLQNK